MSKLASILKTRNLVLFFLNIFILSMIIFIAGCRMRENVSVFPNALTTPSATANTTENENHVSGYPGPRVDDGYPGPADDMTIPAVGNDVELFNIEGNLLFQSDETGTYHIYLRENGSEPINLTVDLSLAVEGVWSPDGNTIAFVTHGIDSTNFVIQLMNADGSNKRSILTDQPELNWRPAWSPNGNELVFVSNRTGDFDVFKVNLDGSGLVNLTNNPAYDRDPDWSQITNKIIFVSDREGGNGLFMMDPDGTNVLRVLDGSWKASFPRWSPDGKAIAFASEQDTTRDIYVMDANGQNIRKVTNRTGDNTMPDWINNDRILFSGDFGDETWDLYVINVDGTDQKRITGQLTLSTYSERYPRWRP